MKLETEKQGRFLARRVIFKLAKAGTEKCRANPTPRHEQQAGALRCALVKLLQHGTREALSGFACVLTDCIGTRSLVEPGELAKFYERMETEGRFRQWRNDNTTGNGDNVTDGSSGSLYPAKGSASSPSPQIATARQEAALRGRP